MPKIISKKEAVSFLDLDEKTFDNYFKNAKEFDCLDRNGRRGRFLFDEGGGELKEIKFAVSFEEALPLLDSHNFDFMIFLAVKNISLITAQ